MFFRADEPWLVLTGDALLVGDAGRPDLHVHGEHTAAPAPAQQAPIVAANRSGRPLVPSA